MAPVFDGFKKEVEDNLTWQRAVTELAGGCDCAMEPEDMDKMMTVVLVAGMSRFGVDAYRDCWTHLSKHGLFPEIRDLTDAASPSTRLAAEFGFYLQKGCHQRRVFRTANSQLGVGPKVMERGDIIAILYGARTPYVLRKYGDYYRIVGECYVYGIMHGEAVREHERLGQEDVIFDIR
jgi:hypothetical protein